MVEDTFILLVHGLLFFSIPAWSTFSEIQNNNYQEFLTVQLLLQKIKRQQKAKQDTVLWSSDPEVEQQVSRLLYSGWIQCCSVPWDINSAYSKHYKLISSYCDTTSHCEWWQTTLPSQIWLLRLFLNEWEIIIILITNSQDYFYYKASLQFIITIFIRKVVYPSCVESVGHALFELLGMLELKANLQEIHFVSPELTELWWSDNYTIHWYLFLNADVQQQITHKAFSYF